MDEGLKRPESYHPTVDQSESARLKEAGVRNVRSLITLLKQKNVPVGDPAWGQVRRIAEEAGLEPGDLEKLIYDDTDPEPSAVELDPWLGPKKFYKLTLVAVSVAPVAMSASEAEELARTTARQMGLDVATFEEISEDEAKRISEA